MDHETSRRDLALSAIISSDDPLWGSPKTAAFLNIPERTLGQWAYRGIGPKFYKVGRHRRYSPADLEAWVQAQAREPHP